DATLCCVFVVCFFFFSSRRRHTRFSRDWSSDVCSSDLTAGAMYNAFGAMLNHKRDQARCFLHRTLVDLLAIQREIQSGLFAIMDGTTAGNVSGSRNLIPVTKNILLASSDQVALDAVAAKLMGFDP